MLLRPSDDKFQQLIMNMAMLCFHNISIDILNIITDFVITRNIL